MPPSPSSPPVEVSPAATNASNGDYSASDLGERTTADMIFRDHVDDGSTD